MNTTTARDITNYASNDLFFDAGEDKILIRNRPYRRPTRTFDNSFINFDKPLNRHNQASNSALSTHRMLLNVYETEGVFLPSKSYSGFWQDFQNFYSETNIAAGDAVRPRLESKAFSFLDTEIDISGSWTVDMATELFQKFLADELEKRDKEADADCVLNSIINSPDPQRCARHYLIQLAPDFLSEASAMARVAPGAYGELQSAIFNILIDEYGASVHANKHSTLFENTLNSVGLSTEIHTYWQFYHATSLCLTNYFHYVTRNKRYFFRYVGALFYTEASLVNTTRNQSRMLHQVFGDEVDTKYFDEHFHIDQHHGDMALKRVIQPAFERFGEEVVKDVVRGFMEFKLLEELASEDLLAQFSFFNELEKTRPLAENFYSSLENSDEEVPLEIFVEAAGERSTTHTHPDHRLLVIESGTMDFWPLFGEPMALGKNDILSVPRHRLHGSVVTSEECIYHQPIAEPDELKNHTVSNSQVT